MNYIHNALRGLLVVAAVVLAPTPLHAHDTEIFFSQAKADNEQNEAIANVFIMLDTSGSMRFCEDEISNVGWCSDSERRRINILQNALREILEDVPEGVRIGIGRFNFPDLVGRNYVGTGGRVLLPVTEIDDAARKIFFEEIEKLNAAGDSNASGVGDQEPRGDTPTGRAYAEATRYMMGMAPVYGIPSRGAATSVCMEKAFRNVGCHDVFDGWGEWFPISGVCELGATCKVEYDPDDQQPIPGVCDTAQPFCDVELGEWQPIPGVCDTNDVEHCKRENGAWGALTLTACDTSLSTCRLTNQWTDWVITRASGANAGNCPNINNADYRQQRTWTLSGFRLVTRCEEQRAF